MAEFYHSVTLNAEMCVGCTNCIKRCPTEAIRVRGGKAVIASERCIDCGECIRICPHHAKRARHSHLSELSDFTYTIALPAPSLYGQFNNLDDIDYVLTGLKAMGFDDVFEVSRAAELVSEATRKLMDAGALKRPVISSACPAVVRLIRVRFPDLCDHVLPLKSPMETAAGLAKVYGWTMAETELTPVEASSAADGSLTSALQANDSYGYWTQGDAFPVWDGQGGLEEYDWLRDQLGL